MAYTFQRTSGRYTGYYKDATGKRRSVGTFDTEAEALVRAKDAEGSPETYSVSAVATMLYRVYATQWVATTEDVMPRTAKGYESSLRLHVLPRIGHLPVQQVTYSVVRDMLREMKSDGYSVAVIAQCKAAIGSSFKPLVPEAVQVNPTHGIVIEKKARRPFPLVNASTVQAIFRELTPSARVFASFLILTGGRFGEASEVRTRDFDFRSGEVTFSRRVTELGSRKSPTASRFMAFEGTKRGRQYARTIVLEPEDMLMFQHWCTEHQLGPDDLVFAKKLVIPENQKWSRVNTTGHMGNSEWTKVWKRAIAASGIGWEPRTHDLRHAFATQLVADGVSIYEVKELMGHSSVDTTDIYLHRVRAQGRKAAKSASRLLHGEETE